MLFMQAEYRLVVEGGPGSGHHGHKGVKGRQGGSVPGGGVSGKRISERPDSELKSIIKSATKTARKSVGTLFKLYGIRTKLGIVSYDTGANVEVYLPKGWASPPGWGPSAKDPGTPHNKQLRASRKVMLAVASAIRAQGYVVHKIRKPRWGGTGAGRIVGGFFFKTRR